MTRPVYLPSSLDEALAVLAENPGARAYHGGTDLLVQLRKKLIDPPALVCLERVEELQVLEENETSIFLGAGLTHARLLDSAPIREKLPLLAQALSVLGSPPIRQAGTLGGNIATASPAGDALPPLYCLDAAIRLASGGGVRETPISDFISGPGRINLDAGELILGVNVPKPAGEEIHHFEKVGLRQSLAIAVVSLAARIALDGDGLVKTARLAWGSVGPTIFTCREAESELTGQPLNMETLGQAASLARARVEPIDDVRASAEYRRQVTGNLLLRLAGFGRDRCE